jgi:hypothetical protein
MLQGSKYCLFHAGLFVGFPFNPEDEGDISPQRR